MSLCHVWMNYLFKMLSCGQGGIDELKQCLDDDKGLYFLYRTTDVVDGHTTVKFVYIAW